MADQVISEAFIETLFKTPAFRVKLQEWFNEALRGVDLGVSADDVDGLDSFVRDMLSSARIELL